MNNEKKLINIALILSLITIIYNLFEGLISVIFGYKDETLSLFGFGVDSFVEVISGAGILHMIFRIKKNNFSEKNKFEKNALKITGISFLLLTFGLVLGALLNFINKTRPETALWGIIISILSIFSMYILLKLKMKVGIDLNSEAIIADAKCTRTCFQLSFILLSASIIYEIFKINYIDSIGALGIAYFSLKEGLEALKKSKNNNFTCSCEKC